MATQIRKNTNVQNRQTEEVQDTVSTRDSDILDETDKILDEIEDILDESDEVSYHTEYMMAMIDSWTKAPCGCGG